MYFQSIGTQGLKKGSQVMQAHPTIQGLNDLGRACRPTATAPVAKPFINADTCPDGIGWTHVLTRP
jgi:hypothetical protein